MLWHHTVNAVSDILTAVNNIICFLNRIRNWVMQENINDPEAQQTSCMSASIWCAPCLGNSDPIARHSYLPRSSTRSQHSWWQIKHPSLPIPLSQNFAAYIGHSTNKCKPPSIMRTASMLEHHPFTALPTLVELRWLLDIFFLCEAKYISSRYNPVVQKMTACFSLIPLTYVPKNGLHHCLSANWTNLNHHKQ